MDIARASGVSQTLVSAVFNHSPAIVVNDLTRQKVLAVADRLGYSRRFTPLNGWGRTSTKTIAWVRAHNNPVDEGIPDAVISAYDSFSQRLFNAVVQQLATDDYSLVVHNCRQDDSLREWLELQRAEGVFWSGDPNFSPEFPAICKIYPLVVLNRSLASEVDRTAVNQVENVQVPIEHLLTAGHRRIAYFGHVPGRVSEIFSARRQAYERIMHDYNLRVYHEFFEISDAPDVPSSVKVRHILALWQKLGPERPTALIMNDFHALHLLQQAQAQQIRIPDDLSVIGIDNVSYCEMAAPRLTSMHQPFEEMGRIAVELMLSRLNDPARLPRLMMVGPQLIERDSVARVECR